MKKYVLTIICLFSMAVAAQKIEYAGFNNGIRVVGVSIRIIPFFDCSDTPIGIIIEQYKQNDIKQYFLKAIMWRDVLFLGGKNMDVVGEEEALFGNNDKLLNPGIFPTNGKILIKTHTGRIITLKSVLQYTGVDKGCVYKAKNTYFKSEDPVINPIATSVSYYPISEEEIAEISAGVEKMRVEYVRHVPNKNFVHQFVEDPIKPKDFAKKIGAAYKAMENEDSKEFQKAIKKHIEEEKKELEKIEKYQKNYGSQSIEKGM